MTEGKRRTRVASSAGRATKRIRSGSRLLSSAVLLAGSAFSHDLALSDPAPSGERASAERPIATVLAAFTDDPESRRSSRRVADAVGPDTTAGEPTRIVPLERFRDWQELDSHWRWDRFAGLQPVVDEHELGSTVDPGSRMLASVTDAALDGRETAVIDDALSGVRFAGVGFPHIERNDRPDADRYKPYEPVVTFRRPIRGADFEQPIAMVRCMGLDPERVARRADRFDALVIERAMEHGVSASLIKAVITEESCFDPAARSHVGAIGLMQLMPATAEWLGVGDPLDPADNVDGGVRYLAYLADQFEELPHVLAAYNAGPARVQRYGGVPPFAETEGYVEKVMAHYRRYGAANRLAGRR